MSDTFDFGKLAFEVINKVAETLVAEHPEIIHAVYDMTLFQVDEYSELEESVANILRTAGAKQGYWAMWFLKQEEIIEVFNELYAGGYALNQAQEADVVRLFGDALDRKVTYWRDTLADAIEQVMEV